MGISDICLIVIAISVVIIAIRGFVR